MKLVKVSGMGEALENFVKNQKKQAEVLCSMVFLSLEIEKDILKNENERMIVKKDDSIILYKESECKKIQLISFPYISKPHGIMSFFRMLLDKPEVEILNRINGILEVPASAIPSMKEFLNEHGKCEKISELSNVLNLMLLSVNDGMQNYNEEFEKQFNELFSFANQCKDKGDFYGYKNSFSLNSANEIVLKNDNYNAIITKENDMYIVNIKNDETDPMEALNNQFSFSVKETLSDLESTYRLSFQKLDQPFVLYHFMLDLDSLITVYKKENNIQDEINPIVKSYEYYLAHWSRQHNVTKEEALWRLAFYTQPEGVDEAGNYMPSGEVLPYSKISESLMNDIHNTIGHKEFTLPVIIDRKNLKKQFKSYKQVNSSWQRFFKDLHETLEVFIEKYKNADSTRRDALTFMKEAGMDEETFIKDLEFYSSTSKELSNISPKRKVKRAKF